MKRSEPYSEIWRVRKVLIEFKDQLARFGYEYLVDFLKSHQVEVETIAQKPPLDATQELMEDLLSIITCFAAKLYGKRSDPSQVQEFKRKIEQALKEEENVGSDKNHQDKDSKS